MLIVQSMILLQIPLTYLDRMYKYTYVYVYVSVLTVFHIAFKVILSVFNTFSFWFCFFLNSCFDALQILKSAIKTQLDLSYWWLELFKMPEKLASRN